jgi:hypothetical protein
MATASATVKVHRERQLPGRRYDRVFFTGMAAAMLVTVLVGFAKTYFLAGVFRAHLPAAIIHVHGALFSNWMVLLMAQTWLVAARRTDLHMKLGIAGFLLACAMVLAGVLAATNLMVRESAKNLVDAKAFYIVPLGDMLIFGTLVGLAWKQRKDSAAHKRYIMVATTALLLAAATRWPINALQNSLQAAATATYVFLAALVTYDLWSTRKVHRATVWASVFLIAVQWIRVPLATTAAWQRFAGWVLSMAR